MPYEWVKRPDGAPEKSGASSHAQGDKVRAELHLWPYRSLPRRGFVLFIGATAIMLTIPLMAVLGTALLWGILPFIVLTVGGIWWALGRSYRDGELTEILTLTDARIALERRAPNGRVQSWEANPYWVQVRLHPAGGPVPDYLTLKGGDREVELGAFLTPEERRELAVELRQAIADLR